MNGQRCDSATMEAQCELPAAHDGEHAAGSVTWAESIAEKAKRVAEEVGRSRRAEILKNGQSGTPDNAPKKQCPHCERLLPVQDFARNATAKDGLQTWCRSCMAQRSRDNRRQAAAYYRALVRLRDDDRPRFDRYYAEEQEK